MTRNKGSLTTEAPRNLAISLERLDVGLPPGTELSLTLTGPDKVSPAQVLSFAIDLRNDGFRAADNISVIALLPLHSDFVAASGDYFVYNVANWVRETFAPKPFVRWDFVQVPARSTLRVNYQAKVRLPGPAGPFAHEILAPTTYILPKEEADRLFEAYHRR